MEIFDDCIQEVVLNEDFCRKVKMWTELLSIQYPDIKELKRIAHNINMSISKLRTALQKARTLEHMLEIAEPVIKPESVTEMSDVIVRNIFLDINMDYIYKICSQLERKQNVETEA